MVRSAAALSHFPFDSPRSGWVSPPPVLLPPPSNLSPPEERHGEARLVLYAVLQSRPSPAAPPPPSPPSLLRQNRLPAASRRRRRQIHRHLLPRVPDPSFLISLFLPRRRPLLRWRFRRIFPLQGGGGRESDDGCGGYLGPDAADFGTGGGPRDDAVGGEGGRRAGGEDGAAEQRVGGVLHGVPAHAVGAGPSGGAGAAIDRAHAGGERGRGRAVGLRPRRRAGALRPPLPPPQGPPSHRGDPHVGHSGGRPHAPRYRRHGHPRGLRDVAPRGPRRPREWGLREPRREEEKDWLRHFCHGDRARAAAGRADDGAAGSGAAVAARRRHVPRHVSRRHRRRHGELHGLHWVLQRRFEGSNSSNYREIDVGLFVVGYIYGLGTRHQPVLWVRLVLM